MRRVLRMFWTVLASLAGCYLLVCLIAWAAQARLVYFPGPAAAVKPEDVGLTGQELFLKTSDGERLFAWYVPHERPRGVVIVCHGNAGELTGRAEYARAFRALGLSTLLFDYRGYGASSGSPDEQGTYLDVEAAYDHVTRGLKFEPGQILVFGESLGGGTAIELALRRPLAGVMVQATFTSIADVGALHYPWLPVRWIARHRYENLLKIPRVPTSVLVLHSPDDEIVPFEHGERLYAAALPPKDFVRLRGSHNEAQFFREPEWQQAVQQFIDRALARPGAR